MITISLYSPEGHHLSPLQIIINCFNSFQIKRLFHLIFLSKLNYLQFYYLSQLIWQSVGIDMKQYEIYDVVYSKSCYPNRINYLVLFSSCVSVNQRLINREMRNRVIGFIIAVICGVLLIILCFCYRQSRCCFRNFRRKVQNRANTTPSTNQTVRTVTGNVQPMTWNSPTERYPSQSQTPPPYYGRQPAYNPGKNYF